MQLSVIAGGGRPGLLLVFMRRKDRGFHPPGYYERSASLTIVGFSDSIDAMPQSTLPEVGKPAPAFNLPASGGKQISLDDFKNKQTVVLYFYPKADTPGCTKEACGFRDALADYDKANIAVLGISPDPVKAVDKFSGKFELNFPLLADADHAVTEKYGQWVEKSMYGKK